VEGELKKLWPLIEQTPSLEWLLLTKRYDQIRKKLARDFRMRYPNARGRHGGKPGIRLPDSRSGGVDFL
jgi:hypothetical protein